MKKIRLFFAAVAALVVSASCQEISSPENISFEKTVNFVAKSVETKTAFGEKGDEGYPTIWTENDSKVKVSLNFSSSKDADVTPSEDFMSASFSADFADDKTNSYTFYSLSPSSVYVSENSTYCSYQITVPTAQNPTVSSVDENAQILAAKSSTFSSWPSEVSFNFSHVTAYGRMELANLNLGTATISSVALTASENWAGRWYYYPNDGTVEANSASATITINTHSASNIWFACAPVDLSGKTISVTVNTTAGPFVKEITWPTNKPFTSGKVYKFAVDMTGITPGGTKTYTKVTDKNQITVDSELLIVANDADYAISTTQNGNNRGQAAVTKTGNTIDNPGPDVQVFFAKAGSKTNTIAFYTGAQYIYAASSSSNYLKSQNVLDDNSSFTLDINDGKAELVAQGDNTRNKLKYNSSSSIFSCYANGQGDVCIYKLNDSGTSTPIFTTVSKYTLTIGSCENGSVSVSAGNETVASGSQLEEGTVVSITATPASGYEFGAWDVKTVSNEPVTVSDNKFTMPASAVNVSASFVEVTSGDSDEPVEETLNRESTGVTGTTYIAWNKVFTNGASYSGQSAGGNSSIQLRATSPSGIVVTDGINNKSVSKVAVTWNLNTAAGRVLDVYGKDTPYEGPADLYDDSKRGTKIGSIVYGSSTLLTFSTKYKYIGVRSSSGALYLTDITITWEGESGSTTTKTPTALSWTGYTAGYTVGSTFAVDGTITVSYSDNSSAQLSASDVTVSTSPDLSKAGSTSAIISYTENNTTVTATANITVSGTAGGGQIATFGTDWNSLFDTSYSGTVTGVTQNNFTLSGTVNGVSLVINNGTSTYGYVKTEDLRVYDGYTITITAPSGKQITKIVSTKGGKTFASGAITADCGTLTLSSGEITWTGNYSSVVFSVTNTGSFATIVVTYTE